MKKNFFTITELFIVLAIFLILFSLLSPVLQKSLAYARTTQCAQQQNSIYISMNFYQDDHFYLPAAAQEISGDLNHFWFEAIETYHGLTESKINSKIQWCPDINDFKTSPSVISYGLNAFKQLAMDHHLSDSRRSNIWWINYWARLDSESDVSNPNNTLLLADHGQNNNIPWTHPAIRHSLYYDGLSINMPAFRHLRGKNVLFLDGHVTRHFKGDFENSLYLK